MANEQPLSARGEVKARRPHLYEGGDGKPLLGIDDVHHAVLRVLEGDEIVEPDPRRDVRDPEIVAFE